MPEVGSLKLIWHGKEVMANIANKVEKALERGGNLVKNEAIRSIKYDPKSGKWYWGRSGRYYQASADLESPAIDTGSLMRSISVLMEKKGTEIAAYVGTMDASKHDSLYKPGVSLILEKGFGMKPRPFLRPALAKMEKQIVEQFKDKTEGKATFDNPGDIGL